MSILSIISNCSERLFSYHWNFTICLLVNFFIIVIPMDCGTLMSTKKDWYREGGNHVLWAIGSTLWSVFAPTFIDNLNSSIRCFSHYDLYLYHNFSTWKICNWYGFLTIIRIIWDIWHLWLHLAPFDRNFYLITI